MLQIRELRTAEIPLLKDFAPPEWNTDLPAVFGRHFGQPYFYPIVAELDGTIVGCANGLLNGTAGWLGNIIVLPPFRGRGIGHELSRHLVEFFRSNAVASQILVATSMGEPVYRKLGFEIVSHYLFFSRQQSSPAPDADSTVRPLDPAEAGAVFALDRSVMDENRQHFLAHFLADGWVHLSASGRVDGFYLPRLSNGPVIASSDAAGIALLRLKLSQGAQACVAPDANCVAADLLRREGFVETARAPRMVLGPDVNWQPERVYSRGSGYCG